MSLKHHLLEACGSQTAIINLVRNWDNGDKFSSNAYDYFRSHGDKVNWVCVVWDS